MAKLWRVDLEAQVTVYVAADTRREAERTAIEEAGDELREACFDAVAFASEVDPAKAPKADGDQLVYGLDEDVSVAEWARLGEDPVAAIRGRREAWPASLTEVAAWLCEVGDYVRSATVDGTAYITDGFAMAVIEGADVPQIGMLTPQQLVGAATQMREDRFAEVSGDALLRWLAAPGNARGDVQIVMIGATPLWQELVLRWLARCVAASGAESIRVGWHDDPTEGVTFAAPGWRVLVMPMRDATVAAPSLVGAT